MTTNTNAKNTKLIASLSAVLKIVSLSIKCCFEVHLCKEIKLINATNYQHRNEVYFKRKMRD